MTCFPVSQHVCMVHTTIHCFAGGCQLANGAIVYLTQHNQVSFVIVKARVAPLKSMTISHLELTAALVAACLTCFVLREIPSECPVVHMWSDSQILLHWIKSQKLLPVFVHHCTTETYHKLTGITVPLQGIQPICCQERYYYYWSTGVFFTVEVWTHMVNHTKSVAIVPAYHFISSRICSHRTITTRLRLTLCHLCWQMFSQQVAVCQCIYFLLHSQCQGAATTQTIWLCHCWRTPQGAPLVGKGYTTLCTGKKSTISNWYWSNLKSRNVTCVTALAIFGIDGLLCCGGHIHSAPVYEVTKFPCLLLSRHSLLKLILIDMYVRLYHSGTTATLMTA